MRGVGYKLARMRLRAQPARAAARGDRGSSCSSPRRSRSLVGALLTRRAVDRSVLRDVSQQADLLAERERVALLPLGHLGSMRSFLERQNERVVVAPLDRPSTYLPGDAAARVRGGGRLDGTLEVGGDAWFFAARPVAGKALVLLRPRVVGAGGLAAVPRGPAARGRRRGRARRRRLVPARPPDLAAAASPGRGDRPARGGGRRRRSARRGRDRARVARGVLQRDGVAARPRTRRRARVPALDQPRAEDAADRDPRLRRGARRRHRRPQEAARTIGKEAARLDRLVRDLLDLARINRSSFGVRSEPVDLVELAGECRRGGTARLRRRARVDAAGARGRSATPTGSCRRSRTSSRTRSASRPPAAPSRRRARPACWPSRTRGPGLATGRAAARVRALLLPHATPARAVGTGLGLAIVDELARVNGRQRRRRQPAPADAGSRSRCRRSRRSAGPQRLAQAGR